MMAILVMMKVWSRYWAWKVKDEDLDYEEAEDCKI
jgi:hypothetical protein